MYYLSLTPESLANIIQVAKWVFFGEFLVSFSLFFTRVSICLFLLRMFGAIQIWRRIIYCATTFIILLNLSNISTVIITCRPMRKNWDSSIHGKCLDSAGLASVGYVNGGKLSHRSSHCKLKPWKWVQFSVIGYSQVYRSYFCGRSKCGQESRQVFAC